jgi:hypothetical protein
LACVQPGLGVALLQLLVPIDGIVRVIPWDVPLDAAGVEHVEHVEQVQQAPVLLGLEDVSVELEGAQTPEQGDLLAHPRGLERLLQPSDQLLSLEVAQGDELVLIEREQRSAIADGIERSGAL